MKRFKNVLRALLAVILCSVFVLAACDGGNEASKDASSGDVSVSISDSSNSESGDKQESDEPDSSSDTGNSEDSDDAGTETSKDSDNSNTNSENSQPSNNDNSDKECEYSVCAVDGNGDPIANMIVQVSGEDFSVMKTTNSKGIAKFTAKKGKYTVSFVSPAKEYFYDAEKCVLTANVTSITVPLLEKAVVSGQLYAHSTVVDDYIEYDYYEVVEGMCYAPVSDGEMTYFLFVPERAGTFEIYASADTEVEIGYYGSPHYVLQSSASDLVDGKLVFDVHNYHIGTTKDATTSYVIGVRTADNSDADCILYVERTGDPTWSVSDEPWQVAVANDKYLVKYNGEAGKTLVDIDITSQPVVVLNENDGYYHYGSADGPLVLVRIASDAKFLGASLVDVCDTSTFGIYVYNDDGSFAYKERYNELIYQYQEICDESGVCPLNPQLAKIIKDFGEYKGWWTSATNPGYIFGNTPAYKYPDSAWLFCCCYYE